MPAARTSLLLGALISLFCLALLTGCESKPVPVSQKTPKPNLTSISAIVRLVNPAVVNIQTVHRPTSPLRNSARPKFYSFPRNFKEFGSRRPQTKRSRSSGFLIDSDGHVATNRHVVHEASKLVVTSWKGRKVRARLIGEDPQTDLALLKLDQSLPEVAYLEMGDSDKLPVGERVLAFGNPFGLENTVTLGIISAKGRIIGAGPYDDFLQTDASINPGNSGGPLVNLQGKVVGINTAILARGQGIGFAIPSSLARPILDQLKEHGRVRRGFLGVIVQKVTPALAASFGLEKPGGALVGDVIPDTPAAQAGIRRGDIILAFDGHQIRQMPDLPRRASLTPVGKKVKLTIFRNGQKLTLSLRVKELPRSLVDKKVSEE